MESLLHIVGRQERLQEPLEGDSEARPSFHGSRQRSELDRGPASAETMKSGGVDSPFHAPRAIEYGLCNVLRAGAQAHGFRDPRRMRGEQGTWRR